jgi:uncharacterized membrane protein YkvA (DUF1232 family)
MRNRKRDAGAIVGAVTKVFQSSKLVWRLMADRDVPVALKLIPVISLLYLISPVDLIPDVFLGLGQLDDIGIVLLALKIFVDLCPKWIVEKHKAELNGEDVVDGSYQVIDEQP